MRRKNFPQSISSDTLLALYDLARRRTDKDAYRKLLEAWAQTAEERLAAVELERDRFLTIATKYCPTDHHDWEELTKAQYYDDSLHLPDER